MWSPKYEGRKSEHAFNLSSDRRSYIHWHLYHSTPQILKVILYTRKKGSWEYISNYCWKNVLWKTDSKGNLPQWIPFVANSIEGRAYMWLYVLYTVLLFNFVNYIFLCYVCFLLCTGLSKKMDGIWNRYNLKSTGRIYTFRILKCSEKFNVLDLP